MDLSFFKNAPLSLQVTGSVLLVLFVAFCIFFGLLGIIFRVRLGHVLRTLRKQKINTSEGLKRVFQFDAKLTHLWNEFRETLHEQKENRGGKSVVVTLRATVPAESYFNSQFLIDGRLRTELFKHFPGIFTGLGIIGTFAGLISGLQAFHVSDNPGQVRESLDLLLHGVFEAFFVSVAAISIAMLVTLIEKALLTSLYRCTEDLAQYIDSLFVSGAGEDYLSRIVLASEEAASQSKILKDSLVGDLKTILQEVTDRQISAQIQSSATLSQEIAGSIRTSLQGPMEKISDLVARASGDQSSAASEMLKDVMSSFSQRLNELFGGQISGIQDLNQKSAQAMQDAVKSLNHLVGSLEAANQRSGDAMAERMAKSVEEMERRQSEINDQTRSFVEQIRQLVSTSQTDTSERLQSLLMDLGKQVGSIVGVLQTQSAQTHEDQRQREEAFSSHAHNMVSSMGESVSGVIEQLASSTNQMRHSVETMERTTLSAIDKMSAGARTLEQGAIAFSQAGDKVTNAMTQTASVANKMTEVSGSLNSSASALQSVLVDYQANREATGSMLVEVRAVVESAKREASLTQGILDRIQSATEKLTSAQKEADTYLEGVTEVLATAHESFCDGIARTLDRANSDFHIKLSHAVGLLGSAIQELEVTVSSAGPAKK